MGYYLNPPDMRPFKQEWLKEIGAVEVGQNKVAKFFDHPFRDMFGILCLVDNGGFEAVAFCYDKRELEACSLPHDKRPKKWFLLDRKKAKELSEYTGE